MIPHPPGETAEFVTLPARLFVYFYSFVVFFSAWGWGRQIQRLLGIKTDRLALTLLQGFCVLIALAGFLAVARLAYSPVLALLLLTGLVFAARHQMLLVTLRNTRPTPYHWVVGAMLVVLVVYNFTTQFPSLVFNFHDDFEKYFTYPTRLLQTGTLDPGPLNALGEEYLGAIAVPQAFILMFFPIPFVNGADASWGLVLVYLLVLVPFRPEKKKIPGALAALLMVTGLYLYYANVSALYLGVALILGMLLWPSAGTVPRSGFFLGAFYATVVALKPTFAPVVLIHFSVRLAFGIFGREARRILGRQILWTAIGAALFILPWILLQAGNLLALLFDQGSAFTVDPGALQDLHFRGPDLLFSGRYLLFSILSVLVWAVPVLSLLLAGKRPEGNEDRTGMLEGACLGGAICVFYTGFMLAGPWLNGYFAHFRYLAPALAAISFCFFSKAAALDVSAGETIRGFARRCLPWILLLPVVLWGGGTSLQKHAELIRIGSMHFFSHTTATQRYRQYMNHTVWSKREKERIAAAQAVIPEGAAVLCWLNANFLLDFGRNRIYDVDPAGLNSPWARIPDVEYFIWQRQGYGVRGLDAWKKRFGMNSRREMIITLKSMQFLALLESMLNRAEILYSDGEIQVGRTSPDISRRLDRPGPGWINQTQ